LILKWIKTVHMFHYLSYLSFVLVERLRNRAATLPVWPQPPSAVAAAASIQADVEFSVDELTPRSPQSAEELRFIQHEVVTLARVDFAKLERINAAYTETKVRALLAVQ
jgi:RecB family endonuclease NucS